MKASNDIHTAGLVRDIELVPKSDDEIRRLNIRRKLELEVVSKFDKTEIDRQECWFLMDSKWLNEWAAFVNTEDTEPPGPVTTKHLLDEGGAPLQGLKSRIDYRGVPPLVYNIFVLLYGRDPGPELPRYCVDIYAPAVPPEKLVTIQYKARNESRIEVNKIKPQWVKWELEDPDEEKTVTFCCGFLTSDHITAFLYWIVNCCWAKRSKERKGIKYSQYAPLRPDADAMLDSMSTHSNVSSDSLERGHYRGTGLLRAWFKLW